VTEKTKVGLIGAGKNSRFYAEKITFCLPLVELAAVPDVFMKAAANRAADYQITTVSSPPNRSEQLNRSRSYLFQYRCPPPIY